MNIFATSPDPIKCAQALDDKRVVKMTLESAQIICTVLRMKKWPAPYKPTHQTHPVVLWAAESELNLIWLVYHFKALSDEYTHRYGKVHKSWTTLTSRSPGSPAYVNWRDLTLHQPVTFCNCSGQPHIPDVFEAYRECLRDKWRNDIRRPAWTNRNPPSWAKTN
jgi:hypothetical protein